MPTIEENKHIYDVTYPWEQSGDEWSVAWGGTDMEWYGTILPRISKFVPAQRILEIGPGFGRWTQFLKDLCQDLVIVDLSEKCIDRCRERFAPYPSITYAVNDGKSLEVVPDNTVDFLFSFDSLVHIDDATMSAYVSQISKKLSADGVAFIHHSNLGEYKDRLAEIDYGAHSRDPSMTADKMRHYIADNELRCVGQELINWGTQSHFLIDCISIIAQAGSPWPASKVVVRNNQFMQEIKYLNKLSELYGASLSKR